MHILKVQDRYSEKEFFQFPSQLYQGTAQWIQTMPHEEEVAFDPEQNPLLKEGEACRWILQNYRGKTIGRVAAFIDRRGETATGFLGFFECIEHNQAANKLLGEGVYWLGSQGIEVVNAPVNPNSLFLKAGLLTEGFDELPVYGSNYHPAYYQSFFESFGFEKHFRQRTHQIDFQTMPLPKSVKEKANAIINSDGFRIDRFCKEKAESLSQDIALVYNQTWSGKPYYNELSAQQIQAELLELLPWIDEGVFLLAYYHDQPIGFFFNLPNINYTRKRAGKGLFRKMREAYFRNQQHKHLLSVLLGVLPEFQQRGVASALIKTVLDFLSKHEIRYDKIEINRVSDDQTAIQHLLQQFKGEPHQHYWVYRKSIPITQSIKVNQESATLKQ
ncbi:MAG: GNAT family N-acetyltransferase [Bacteroidota bacterium]